ncbi:MAG: Flp pilus assembly complex ATPase component TadA [Acidobacteria bacterium]|nr:Flp pilus assembly complex ATPase component TadA [Acidobacteriota bacterium]
MLEYIIQCWNCLGEFDVFSAVWCGCDPKNPTKLCPFCLNCFCSASAEYKSLFWKNAPPQLAEEKSTLSKSKDLLGDMLVRMKKLTTDQLLNALRQQKLTGEKLGEILVRMNFIEQEDLDAILAQQQRVLSIDLKNKKVDASLVQNLGLDYCFQHNVIPVERETMPNKTLTTMAMSNPTDVGAIEWAQKRLGSQIVPMYSPKEDILAHLNALRAQGIGGISTAPVPEGAGAAADAAAAAAAAAEAKTKTAMNNLLATALQTGASDLHLEPAASEVIVRARIDGVLFKMQSIPKELEDALFARLKSLAKLNAQARGLPQSGKIPFKSSATEYELQVQTFPTPGGESINLKILDKGQLLKKLDEIGLNSVELTYLMSASAEAQGLIIVSGPLFNGTPTTLYSLMQQMAAQGRRIVSIENTTQVLLPGVTQLEVRREDGFGLDKAISAAMNLEPQVICMFDFNDIEMAKTAQKVANSVLVIAEIDARSSTMAIPAMVNLGYSPQTLAHHLRLVMNQRLVRKVCQHCKERLEPSDELLKKLDLSEEARKLPLYKAKGCARCHNIGYSGRIPLYEVIYPVDAIRQLTEAKASAAELEREATRNGLLTLGQNCLNKVSEGLTTPEEYLKAGF